MKIKLTFVLSALLFLSSCTSTIRRNHIWLIDNSLTVSQATLSKYISIMQQEVLHFGRYDRLTVQFIDECSMTESERVFALDLATMNFTKKTDGMNNAEDSTKTRLKRFLTDSIQHQLETVILEKREERKHCGNFTDIINALNEVKVLVTYGKSYSNTTDQIINNAQGKENYEYENCIIIFSDMVNENRERTMDFTKFGNYSSQTINNKLEEIKQMNKIPNLAGSKIFIYGATSTTGNKVFANKQIENCKIFWQRFFQISGAELKGYAFDSQKEITEYMVAAK